MGGPLCVIRTDIHMIRSVNAVVRPLNASIFKRFIDGIYTKGNKNTNDILFKNLNSFHPNISLTFEANPKKFLNIKTDLNIDGTITPFIYRKETKLSITWISKSSKRYKQNTIVRDLHNEKNFITY